jgi:hypothetical protein
LDRILDLELRTLRHRLANRTQFVFSLTELAKGYLLQEGTDVRYGARHLKRAIERSLVHPMCNLMATGQVCAGDWIRVDFDTGRRQLAFYKDAENVGLTEMAAIDPGEIDLAAAAVSVTAPVATFRSAKVRSIRRA